MTTTFDWLLIYAAKASLLCGAALLLLCAMRRLSATFRSSLIIASAIGVLLLPFVSGLLPPFSLSGLITATKIKNITLEETNSAIEVDALIGHPIATDVLHSAGLARLDDSALAMKEPKRWIAWLVLAGMTISILVYLARIIASLRLYAKAVPLPKSDPLTLEVLAASVSVRLKHPPALRVSQQVPVPFTSALGHSSIILPAGFGGLSAESRRAVLLHECAHLRRRDTLSQLLISACRCLHWFNPLVLALDRAFNAEAEKACDDAVIAAGITPETYSETILHFCQASSASPTAGLWVGAASGYYPSSRFDRKFRGRKRAILSRIQRIVDPAATRRTALGAVLSWVLIVSALLSASMLGSLILVPDYEWRYQLSERALPNASDLIASWRMDRVDESDAGRLFTPDTIGGIGDGLVAGAEIHSEGRVASALRFDGQDDYVDMGSRFEDLQFPITLSAWVRTEGEAEHVSQNVVWLGSGELDEYIYIGLNFGKAAMKSRHGEPLSVRSKQRIDDGEWHHIAGVFISENERLLYADGELVAEDSRQAPKPRLLNLQVGRNGRRDRAASYTRGSVDDVRVYGAALDPASIREIMAGDFRLVAARHEVDSN